MWFGLLGTLQVRIDDREVAVSAAKQRVLLAALLLTPGQAVPAARMAELVWDGLPPEQATVTLRSYVKRLRHALGAPGKAVIITSGGGYRIDVTAGQVDIGQFDDQLRMGADAAEAGDWRRAAVLLDQALALWRGTPLADVPCQALQLAQVPRLEEQRLQAIQSRIEAGLHLGQHDRVTPQLLSLVAEYPLREAFHGQLMVALYRSGRQGDALTAYRTARGTLVSELGLEPGPELTSLHQRILAGDRELLAAASIGSGQPDAARVPRQLPPTVSHFTGRAAELDALTGMLSEVSGTRATVISALGGAAGVGKTAVAVHWAHQVAGHFRDGQLYVNLRGYDPAEPVSTADALAGFLRALGVPGQEIPDGVEERSGLYRSSLAGRRVLVVLDNARDSEQVRPLLPGDRGCAAVITSRDALAGLVATDGARRLDLDVLPLAEAVALLRSLIGPRADQSPAVTAELAGLCARLPLALRIAAELAAARPSAALAELAAELAAARLDLLDAGEDQADVRTVFSWSVRQLPDDVAGAFALIGLHPGEDLDVYATAALTGTTTAQARRMLARLHRASLIQAASAGRYGLHDLLRAYAREQAAARDTGGQSDQAATRLFDYYQSAAAAAADVLFPAEAYLRPCIPPTGAVVPEMPGETDARAWLNRERANLASVVVHCAGHGWPRHVTSLAGTLFGYLMTGSHLPEAQLIYGHALQAARQSGDAAAEGRALGGLGGIALMKGHFRDGADHYRAALEIHRKSGDRARQASALRNLGITEFELHNYQPAADYYHQAIAAYQDAGDRIGTAIALSSLASVEIRLDSHDQATEHLQVSLPVFREAKDQLREAEALSRMGRLSVRRGQLIEAGAFFEQALTIYRRIDSPGNTAAQLFNLGDVVLRQGDYRQAIGLLRQALEQFRQLGDQHGEILALGRVAEALHRTGQSAAARAELETALRLAAHTGNTYEQARVHQDLADSHHQTGDDEQARQHLQQALDLYTQLGAPEADQVRAQLSGSEVT